MVDHAANAGYLIAVLLMVAGAIAATRADGRRRSVVFAATIIVAVAVAWVSWLLGTSV